MSADWLASPTLWAAAFAALLIPAYLLYQVHGYHLLCRQHERLRDFRGSQRLVYRSLEASQECFEALVTCVPHAARPAPYAEDDARAIELRGELQELLAGLREGLRPLEVGPSPRLTLAPLLTAHYWRVLQAREQELESAKALRRELGRVEAALDELEAVLVRQAGKPQEVESALGNLQAMAGALTEEIELERRAGNEGLVSLVFEARAVQAKTQEWRARLREAREGAAPQAAVEAEAARRQLLARLTALYHEVGTLAGIHDHAERGLERLDAALEAIEQHLPGLRPALAAVLVSSVQAMARQRQALRARYRKRDVEAYEEVSRKAWPLVAQARSLHQQQLRVGEADARVSAGVEGCFGELAELSRRVLEEERTTRSRLDASREVLARAATYTTQLRRLWAGEEGFGLPTDPADILARLDEVETVAEACTQELAGLRRQLASWETQRTRAQAVLSRAENHVRQEGRVAKGWQALTAYNRANWPQLEAGWYDAYCRERDSILAAAAEARAQLGRGEVSESGVGDLVRRCEELDARRERLQHEAQRLTSTMNGVRAAERQVLEGIAALRPEVESVAAIDKELPVGPAVVAELHEIARDVVQSLARLEQEARAPAQADLRRLRDQGIARVHERLAVHKLSYARLLEDERATLKRRLALLWEQWEPLSHRLAKATPATEIDRRSLGQRWDAIVRAARKAPVDLRQIVEWRGQAEGFAADLARVEGEFHAEREKVRQAELSLARERRATAQVRDGLPRLLAHPHPRVVDEEWERSTKAWRKAEAALRRLEGQRGVAVYLSRLDEAVAHYQEARARAHSALVRILRYAFLEDPEGMHEACLPLGRRWGRLGVTAREAHIRDLLRELEQAGQLQRLVERVGGYLAGRAGAAG